MLSYSCSQRLILAPSIPKVWFFYGPGNRHLLTRNTGNSEFYPKFSKNKCKISCFRDEDIGPVNPKLDNVEKFFSEELKNSGLEKSGNVKRGWRYILREAADGVLRGIRSPWAVPWTSETILQVMLLWVVSFWFIGSWVIPIEAHLIGIIKESPTFRAQALFSLVTDATEGLTGIAILHRCLSRFHPLPSGWFWFTMRGNWQFDVALG